MDETGDAREAAASGSGLHGEGELAVVGGKQIEISGGQA